MQLHVGVGGDIVVEEEEEKEEDIRLLHFQFLNECTRKLCSSVVL